MIRTRNQRLQNQRSSLKKTNLRQDIQEIKQQLLNQNIQLKNILSYYTSPLKECYQNKSLYLKKSTSLDTLKSSKQYKNVKQKTKRKAKDKIILSSSLCKSTKTIKQNQKKKHEEDSFYCLKPKYPKKQVGKYSNKCNFCKNTLKLKQENDKKLTNQHRKIPLSPLNKKEKNLKSVSEKSQKKLYSAKKNCYPSPKTFMKVQSKNQTLRYLRL